jgi:vitamin B12/bleomycin/antimicrobial peptide transport system ATP-binding/permease protein
MLKQLVLPVIKDRRSWKYLASTLALALAFIAVGLWYTKWISQWMNAFESKDFLAFKYALAQFALLAIAWVITYGYRSFFRKKLSFVFREIITERLIQHFQANGVKVQNFDQRVAEDPIRFSELFTNLALQALSSMISLPLYLYLLFTTTPWYVSVMGIVYAGVTTIFAKKIAGPLQKLDYEQQSREANYRYHMVQIREGNTTEIPTLEEIKINWLALATRAKILSFFQSGQNLASNILPLVVLAPAYFIAGSMTLGGLWATRNIWGEVLDALSFFVNSYDSIAELNANTQRMIELLDSNKPG